MLESTTGRPPFYLPSPSTLWTPTFPLFEQFIDPRPLGITIWTLRLLRLAWIISLLPLHILLVSLYIYAPSLLPFLRIPPSVVPGIHRQTWTPAQRYIYPLLSRFIWSIAGTGGNPPTVTPEMERSIPLVTRWVEWLSRASPLDVRQEDVRIEAGMGMEDWFRGEAIDPRGEVLPIPVACFWLERQMDREQSGSAFERVPDLKVKEGAKRAREGERVVLLLAGGGYIQGSPLQGCRAYDIARQSGLRVFGANYRKAVSPGQSFPAALQDALVAYVHLVVLLGFNDIVIVGDSAGAGLAMTLQLYLSTTLARSSQPPKDFVLPSALVLYSPWVDLTLSTFARGTPPELRDDFLNPTMLNWASQQYLTNTFARPFDKLPSLVDSYESSPYALRTRHPFFSPALPSSLPTLRNMANSYSTLPPLKILVISGTAELFAVESRKLVKLLATLGRNVEVEHLEEEDELHVFMLVPKWVSPGAVRALRRVRDFLLDSL